MSTESAERRYRRRLGGTVRHAHLRRRWIGAIDEIGLKGGYGKYIRIRHANGYQTAYGHMTAFARGLNVGSRVRQGQVIGFVRARPVSRPAPTCTTRFW